MKTACTHCGTPHELRDSDLGAHPKVQFRCSKCGQTTVVEVRRRADSTVVISPQLKTSFSKFSPGHPKVRLTSSRSLASSSAGKGPIFPWRIPKFHAITV